MKRILFILSALICISFLGNAQNLTISSGGNTGTSGSNWSLTDNGSLVTITYSNTANINNSVIELYLNQGKSVLVTGSGSGSGIVIGNTITKTSSAASIFTLKSTGFIAMQANSSIKSTSGAMDVIMWCDTDNSQNGASTNNDEINMNEGVSIETRGGKIVLAGGLDDKDASGNAGSDGIPDGYAYRGAGGNLGGVNLGQPGGTSTVNSYISSGGDIIIRGWSRATTTDSRPGVTSQANLKIDSGTGKIEIKGISSVNHGIEFSFGATPNIAITSSYAGVGPAIQIAGGSNSTNMIGLYLVNGTSGNFLIQSTSTTGGGLLIQGTKTTNTPNNAIQLGNNGSGTNVQLLSAAGDIVVEVAPVGVLSGDGVIYNYGSLQYGNRLNSTAVQGITPAVTASNANIVLRGDNVVFDGSKTTNIGTTGTFTLVPFSNSFINSLTYPITNLALANTVSGLTLGKSTNTANITFGSATSIAGPITAYGGTIAVNSNLTSTASTGSGISLNGQKIIHAAGVSATTSGSNIDYLVTNSPWTASADIGISLNSNNGTKSIINAQGGNITINSSFATVGTNNSASTYEEFGIAIAGTDILTTNTGTISINGDSYNNASTEGSLVWGVDLKSGTKIQTASGAINITGKGGKTLGNARGVISNQTNLQVLSNSGAITFNDLLPLGNNANYTGMYFRPSPSNAIKIGADGSTVASSTSNISFNADKITFDIDDVQVSTSGKVTLAPEGISFAADFTNAKLNLSSNLSELVVGKSGNTGNIVFGRATTIAGPITAYGGTIAVNQNLNTTAGSANGDVLLKASADIVLAASKSITTTGGDAILWSNSDGETINGGVFFDANASIATSGGHIWIGGSSNDGTPTSQWNGLTVGDGHAVSGRNLLGLSTRTTNKINWEAGVLFNETSLNSAGGNIYIAGQRNARTNHDVGAGIINYNGTNGTTIDSGTGTIEIKADGSHTADVTLGFLTGLHPGETTGSFTIKSANATEANAISIQATNATTDFAGLLVEDDTYVLSTAASNGGAISVIGSSAGNNFGAWVQVGSLNLLSASGKVNLDAGVKGLGLHVNTSFTNSLNQLISNTGYLYLGSRTGSTITSSAANIDILSDRFIKNTGSSINVASTGSLAVHSKSASFSEAFNTNQWNFPSNLGGLNLGKTTNNQNITFDSAVSIAGPITAYGNTIAVNAVLTSTNSNINLTASTAATQTAAITANGLALNGAGTFTLTNAANNIATLAGGSSAAKIGSLSFVDASGGLEIGTVNPTGITSTGPVKIETLEGNITLSQNIATDNTTADAIILNAGKNAAIGTATGGDIIVSGTPTLTMGSGGIAKLFSGSEGGSTGLNTLVGAANMRESVDETSAVFSPALSINNKYALYRKGDAGLGGLTIVNSGGAALNSGWEFSNNTIKPTSGTAVSINASVINNYLASGPLSIRAGSITFNANINSTTANSFSVLSNTFINNSSATSITTQNGDVLFATNVDDVTDNESTTNGTAQFRNGLTMTTNGGDITIGGENITGTGYALGSSDEGLTEGIRIDGIVNINSSGGNIVMRGKSYARTVQLGYGASGLGFYFLSSTGNINSGSGTIDLDGYSQTTGSGYSSGIIVFTDNATFPLAIQSANQTADAIKISGKATGTTGDAFGIETEATTVLNVLATGTGGGITLSTGNKISNGNELVFRGTTSILAKSGPIKLLGAQDGGLSTGIIRLESPLYMGSRAGTIIPTSTSNVTVQFDLFQWDIANGIRPFVGSTGAFELLSTGSSFSQGVSSGFFKFGENSQTLGGLTIGKTTNTTNITFNEALSVAGPINAYGGTIAINENLNTTAGNANGDVLLKASANITTAASKSITSNGGDVIMWSDSDNTSGGSISIGDNYTINTTNGATTSGLSGGGTIVLAGGLDNGANGGTASDGVPDGFASNSSNVGINLGTSKANYSQMYSGGGDIILRANSTASGTVEAVGLYQWGKWLANSGQGAIDINGKATSFYGINFTEPASNVTTGDMHLQLISAKTSGNAITINGTSTNNYGVVFNYDNPKEILATGGGDIIVNGTGGGTSQGIFLQNQDILASAGTITMNGGTNGFSFNNAGTRIGSKTGSTITSSTANVKLIANAISPNVTSINTSGTFTFEPFGNSFTNALTYPISNLTLGNTISGLTLGKQTNTQNITFGSTVSISGPITAYGGAIAVNENLNTTTGTASGDIFLKSFSDISLAASKSIITAGGDVILWSNSDNAFANGSISLRNGSSITTGSGSVAGGHVWLGGGNDGVTWNGLSVGSGYAVPGTSFTPSNGGSTVNGGIYLEGSSINSFGGHVKLAGNASTSNYGILTYATNSIDSKAGTIELEGNATNTASESSSGILFGIHDVSSASTMNLTSSASDVAIKISGIGRGTGDAIGLSGTLNVLSTGTGELSMNGNAFGSGRSIVAGNYYSGILNAFANTGNISLNGGTKAVTVAAAISNGATPGPSKINLGKGSTITNSSSDVFITADNIAISDGGIAVNSTGKVTIESSSDSFASALTFPIANLSLANSVSGLTLGKSGNNANITFGSATSIAGPIKAYGGTLAINGSLTATNNDITLGATNAVTQTQPITANGLALLGAGTVTLNNSSNNIVTIAGGTSAAKIGSLSFSDASGGLTIGTVNPTGVYAVGTVKIETLTGDITLSENIQTDNTSTDAIILNAGKNTAIGTATGGDIIVSGTPTLTMGTGGIAKLFSGSEGESTGLNTLVGASNVRESVDETSAAFNPALSINNKYALYRFGDAGSTVPTQNIWYVDNNSNTSDVYTTSSVSGNDATGTGSASAPFATLTKAVTSASAGDIIYVDSGTYSQNSIIINKKLTIIGAGSGNTIFDNGNGGQLWANITSSDVTIKNLTLTKFFNANGSFGQVININGPYTGINFENIVITNCLGATSTLPNVSISGGASVTIRNSFFKCSGYNGAMGGGLLVNNSTAVIENTIFFQNESASSSENGGAIQIKGASANVTVTNCTFNGCVSLKGGAIGQNGGTLTITGSCFSNNISETDDNSSGGGAIFVTGTSNTSISNCLFDTNAVTAQAKGTTSISVGNATSADGGAICFKNVNGTASVTNSRFVNNGKLLQTDGQILINGFDDGQDIFYSGSSLNITINNNTFSSANSGEVNIYEDATGNQTMSNNGIYTQTGSTGPTVNALSTTRTGVSDGTQTGWSDTSLTGTTTINMLGSLLTPIRTDVYSTCSTVVFTGWIDNSVTQGGTCNNAINQPGYLNLSSALSSTISPAMIFTTSSAGKYLTFRARTNGGTSTAANAITVSVSTDNGTNWTTIGTRTPTTTTLTQMTPFDLSTYTGTQVKVRFQSLSATGTIGVGIDDIVITSASTLITPSLDFSNKGVQVLYTSALVGGTSSTYNLIKTSISEDNGTTWTQINTSTTAGTYTLDLYNYHGTTTKLKFETPYANGTSGASLDNIIFNFATSSNTNPETYCQSTTSITGCNSTLNCSLETLAPIILNCVENKSIADCSLIVPDYRSEVAAYDDCSFTISQSPAPGTLLSSLGNGNHTITFIVSDLSTYSQDTSCSMVLTVSGCAVCTPPSTPSATVTVQPTSATTTGTIVFTTQSGVEYSIDGTNYQASPTFTGVAANTYTLKVRSTSDNSCTATGSTVTVNAAPNAPSAHLASLTVAAGTLSPIFDTNVTDYAVLLPAGTNSFSFTPTLTEGTASMTINEVAHNSGTVLTSNIASKSKTFIIQVTSADNTVVKEYTLTVVVPSATDALAVVGQSVTEDAGYVRFILTGKAAQKVSLELADITAKGLGLDYGAPKTATSLGTSNLESSIDLGKTWTVFTNFVSIPATKLLWVRTPLNDDALIESQEKFKLIVSPVDDALTGMEVYDINYNLVNLNFPATTLSGTAKTVGAVYHQLNAVTIDGQVLDARMEIKGISNVPSTTFIVDNSSANPTRFESEINANSSPAGGSFVDYELKFYKSGSNIQVGVKNFYVTAVDVDGTSTLREYIELNNFSSYQVGTGSSLNITNPRAGFTRYTSSSAGLNGIAFEETATFVLNYTNPIASLAFRKGITDDNISARLFSIAFGNSIGTFSSSISTESTSSVSAEGIIIDNDFPAPTQLTITAPQLTKIKDYSGTNTAVVVPGTITGIKTGDNVTLTATATYETNAAGTGKKITVVYTLSGTDAADYLAPVNFVVNDGTINPLKITITPTSGLTKVYGSADPTLNYSQTGALSTETAAFTGSITRATGNDVGKYEILVGTLALANNGTFKTSNYTLNFVENVEMAITKATLTVTVKDDSKFVSTADVTGFAGITYAGFVYGETKAVITETSLLISRSNSTIQAPQAYNDVLIASGLSSNNYSFNYIAGDFTIVAADQLLVKIKDKEVVYGQPVVYEIASAKYLSSAAAVIVDLTANASNNNGKVTITDGAGGKALFDLNVISASLSSSSRLEVGSYLLGATNIVETSVNFNNTIVVQGNLTITPLELFASVKNGLAKVYDSNREMKGLELELASPYSGDLVDANGVGTFGSQNAGAQSYSIGQISLSGDDALNYFVSGGASAALQGTNGQITKRSIEITPDSNQGKTFAASDPTLTYDYSGNIDGETPGFSGTLSRINGENPGNYEIEIGNVTLTNNGTFLPNNYDITFIEEKTFNINQKSISSNDVTVSAVADLIYNGGAQTPKPIVKDGVDILVEGVDYTLSYSENTDAGTATITITGIGDYSGTRTITFKIKPAELLVTPDSGLTKVYGRLNPVFTYTYSGNKNGETPKFSGALTRETGQDVAAYEIMKGSLVLLDSDNFKSSNYKLVVAEGVEMSISKASLTVIVKDDSKFITKLDVPNYAGINYDGFVFGQDASVIDQTLLTIARSNSSTEAAGEYEGVLEASGLSSDNYSFNYQDGDYVIVAADQLLVKVQDQDVIYGQPIMYQIASAKYLSTSLNNIVDLTANATVSNGKVTITDGVGGTALFDLAVTSPSFSTSSRLEVGAYKIDATNIIETSPNFSNTIVVQGNLNITPKQLVASVTGGLTKEYDGHLQMNDLTLALATPFAGDKVDVSAKGVYDSESRGSRYYTVSDMVLAGIDSENYYVQGGASATLSGSNAEITKRKLVISPDSNQGKVFGESDSELTYTYSGNVIGTIPAFTGVLVRDEGEAQGEYEINLGSIALIDNDSFISSNYDLVFTEDEVYTINKKNISSNGFTVDDVAPVIYNGQNHLPEPAVKDGDIILIKGVDYNYFYSENKDAGTATITIGGINDYSGSRTVTFLINPAELTVIPDTGLTKIYGDSDPELTYTYSGQVAGETPDFEGVLTRSKGEDAGLSEIYQGSLSLVDNAPFKANNYTIKLIPEVEMSITRANLSVQVNSDSKFVTKADLNGYAGLSFKGFKFGEDETALDFTNLKITRINEGIEAALTYEDVLSASGLASGNYAFNYLPGDYTIIPAEELRVKIAKIQTVYGETASYSVESASYVAPDNSIVDLTASTSITNGKVNIVDGASGTASFDINLLSPVLSTAGKLAVGSYNLGASNISKTSTNFSNTIVVQGLHTVIPKELTVSVSSSKTKVYDANAQLPELTLALATPYSLDKVSVSGTGVYNSPNAGIQTYTVNGMVLSGDDAANYFLTGGADALVQGTDGQITKRELLITPKSNQTKVFGEIDPILNYDYSGNVSGENPTFTGTLSREVGQKAGLYEILIGSLVPLNNESFLKSNYDVVFAEDIYFEILSKNIQSKDLTLSDIEDRTYDGSPQTPKPIIMDGEKVLIEGIDYELVYTDNVDAGTSTITIKGKGDYTGERSITFVIKPRELLLTPDSGLTKVYGSADPTLTYTYSGNVVGETPGFTGTLSRVSGENAALYEINLGSLNIVDNGGFKIGNYIVKIVSDVDMTITRAPLIVKVNNDSKFVTKLDVNNYAGIRYEGFKFGERRSVIDETNLRITRTNAGIELAKVYPGVLSASGVASGNYSFTYEKGDFTIVGADQLLVKIADVDSNYGDVPTYGIISAEYLSTAAGFVVVDLISNTTISGRNVTVQDGASGNAVFDISEFEPVFSTANKLAVRSYVLSPTNIVETSPNFKNTVVLQGIHVVSPIGLTATVTSLKSKVYDGNAQMPDLQMSLAAPLAQDKVTVNGRGVFSSKNAGPQSYTVDGMTLSGVDSDNYYVLGGASALIQGNDGVVSKRKLKVTPDDGQAKIYGQADPILVYDYDGNLISETPKFNGLLSRESGEPKADYKIELGTLSLSNNGSFLASNYEFDFTPNVLFNIDDKNIASSEVIAGSIPDRTYNGLPHVPKPVLKDGFKTLVEGVDYTLNYTFNTESGTAVITVTGIGDYSGTRTINFQIVKAALIVLAEDKGKTVGAADPSFTVKYTGFVNGETKNVLSGTLQFNRAAGEVVGDYDITPSGLSAANYQITFSVGILSIGDSEKPNVIIKNITVELDENGQIKILPSQVDNGSNDLGGIASMLVEPSVFTCANIGPNTVTLTVTDSTGNKSTATAIVTVVDRILPTVKTKNITVELDAKGQASLTAAQIDNGSFDNCAIKSMLVSQASFNCANVGANTVTLTVTDINGNLASTTAVVTVINNSIDSDKDSIKDNCDEDDDNDGLTDVKEVANGTESLNPDSDGDGVSDGQEILDGTNPKDACSYSLTSQVLAKASAEWLNADCDKDGLTNGEETTGIDNPSTSAIPKGIKTDPRNADSDGDGVSDAQEAFDGTNPNDSCSYKVTSQMLIPNAAWANADCDGDGVTNGKERADVTNSLINCDFKVSSRTLAPNDAWKNGDCDGDGLKNEVDGVVDCDNDGIPNFQDFDSCKIDIMMPNVFTPNGDGINEEIKPVLLGIDKFICFKIFNRWGNIIFETTDRNKGWDGSYKESNQGTETFKWLSEGYDRDGNLVKRSGMVTLLR